MDHETETLRHALYRNRLWALLIILQVADLLATLAGLRGRP